MVAGSFPFMLLRVHSEMTGIDLAVLLFPGAVSYFSDDDKEDYPYREDSSGSVAFIISHVWCPVLTPLLPGDEADEEEAMARKQKKEGEEVEVEEEWEEEDDEGGEMFDDFGEEGLPQARNWSHTPVVVDAFPVAMLGPDIGRAGCQAQNGGGCSVRVLILVAGQPP